MGDDVESARRTGRAALASCRWSAAADAFISVLSEVPDDAEALDGLAQARYWQQEYAEAFALRERAFVRHRELGDRRAAALLAVRLAQWHGLVHGNAAALNGWLGHAQRLVEEEGECPEVGWVELFRGCISSDPAERERRTTTAVELGRRFAVPGLEFDALSYVGKARVEQGAVGEGMALIDEAVAAAASGLVTDPWAAGEIWCVLFHACELAVDVPRADAWLHAVTGYVERTGELPIQAICRMHYGAALGAAGRFAEAEQELRDALSVYEETYRGTRSEPTLRLAELLARWGRTQEAAALLAGHEDAPAAARTQALLHLDAGEAGEPAAALRVLRRVLPDGAARSLADARTLSDGVEAAVRAADAATASRWADELNALGEATRLPGIRGLGVAARARAAGAGDPRTVELLERAIPLLAEGELTHDVACTRLTLARALARTDPDGARAEARTALAQLQRLEADRDADRAAALLRELGAPARSRPRDAGAIDRTLGRLTSRQREVLALVADGMSNAEIAERLVLSHRTVEHHVSNILATLGVRSRTEAAALHLRGAV